jgi:vanillate/3-O-methylgallate O-demethylase
MHADEPRGTFEMTPYTLEQKLQRAGGAVRMARGSQVAALVSDIPGVPPEVSNWRDEQVAWRETAALLDLTHHMTDLTIEGPDAIRLLCDLGVNSFQGFRPGRAKQFVCCSPEGYLIGDCILFYPEEGRLNLLGLPAAHNWVQYHAQSGRYDVSVLRDEPTLANPTGRRRLYRYQIQGPRAYDVLSRAGAGEAARIGFFHIGMLTIADCRVRTLHHGMSGAPGVELFGPWEERHEVRAAILEAGHPLGLRQVGYLAYPTTTLESGWVVDSSGRVHGTEGLRVADASIFPTIPRGYPHFIVIMAAEKIADAVKASWSQEALEAYS